MALVSLISTMKVDCPRARLSLAPTLVKSRSATPISAADAGTNEPSWAITTESPICRRMVDLPAMLGPVTSSTRSAGSNRTSLGMKDSRGISRSITG
jgi:hypothetical protein